jgi:hypothetical protein
MTEVVAMVCIVGIVAVVAIVNGRIFRGKVDMGGAEVEVDEQVPPARKSPRPRKPRRR